MHDADLCYLPARKALSLFAKKKLSPVEVISAQIARYEATGAAINAFADRYFDEALLAARKAEKNYQRKSFTPRALEGLSLGVKDAQRVKGKRTTHGSLIFMDTIDDHSDPMIERLEAAGAIILARTTTPEFCLTGACHSRAWGVTRNPWHLDYGPGGSSGGSGAALAAGLTTLATGTDIGGSIRIPASACGVVGFKPPHGRNPDGPPNNFDRFNHCGPMTRSVGDAALMQRVTAGPHPLDADSLRNSVDLPLKAGSLKGFRIAYSLDFGYVEVDADVARNFMAAIKVFKSLGAKIEPVDLNWNKAVDEDCQHWYNTMNFGRQTIWYSKTHADKMTDYALEFARQAEKNTTMDDVHKAFARAHQMYQSLGPVLSRNDVLLCPTNNLPAISATHDPWNRRFTINGKTADAETGWVMTHQFNMLQNLPVMSVPSGFAATGVPTGLQIVGKSFDDATVFKAALAFEGENGGWFSSASHRPQESLSLPQ